MRNLKRVLSLTLASVMLLGMMVIGSSAAEITKKDFTDADEIEYTEAVDVMVALEVIEGNPNGGFNPKGTLTREQAAKIICHMLLGAENAEKLTTNTVIFTDVAAGRWSAGYIAYCAQKGILAGTGNGNFNPTGELTGVAFGKMLLVALGYDPELQNYTGSSWAINVASDMIDAGIDVKGTILSATLTREQAAQMAFQTLTADMVDYADRGFTYEGLHVGASKPESVTSDNVVDYDSSVDDIQQFCEKYFVDLTKGEINNDFGRPVNEWSLDGDSVGKYVNKSPAVTFTTKQSADDVEKALRNYKIADTQNSTMVKINATGAADSTSAGVLVANGDATPDTFDFNSMTPAAAIADETGNGVCVEIYANNKKEITSIVTLTYTVETVNSVVERKDGDYTRTTYGLSQSSSKIAYTDPDKDSTAVAHADLDRDDIVVTLALDNGETHIYLTEQVNGVQTSYNSGKETVKVDGKDYTVGTGVIKTASGPANLTFADSDSKFNENSKDEITLYLDLYGNVVKKDAVASKDYAVIDAIRWTENTTDLDSNGSATARLIFTDGTTETVTLNEMTYNSQKNKFEKDSTAAISGTSGTTHKVTVNTTETTVGGGNGNEVYQGLIVTYTKANNGKYNVTVQNTKINSNDVATGTAAATVVTKGVPALKDTATGVSAITGNNDTIYIVKSKSGDDTKYNAYTGYQNVPTIEMSAGQSAKISYVRDGDAGTVAKYIFIDASAGSSVGDKKAGDIVYVFTADYRTEGSGSDIRYFYTNVALNGEKVDEEIGLEVENTSILSLGWNEVERDDDGVVTGLSGDPAFVGGNVTADADKGIMKTSGASYTYDGSETVYVIDAGDETAYEGAAESAQEGDVVYVNTKSDSGTGADRYAIKTAYVIKDGGALPAGGITEIAAQYTSSTNTNAVSAELDGTTDTQINVAAGGTWADGDKITLTPTLSSGASMTVNSADATTIVLTRTSGSFAAAGAIVVTGADGSTKTYTVVVTEKNNLATVTPGAFSTEDTNGSGVNISASVGTVDDNAATITITATAHGSNYDAGATGSIDLTMATGATKEDGDASITFTWDNTNSKWTWDAGSLVVKSEDESTTITYSWAAST